MAYNKDEWALPNPYGRLSFIFLIVTIFASMFFWIAAFHCFLTVAKTDEYSLYIGYWQRESLDISTAEASSSSNNKKDGNYCVAWDEVSKENFFDGLWKFGKTLGVLGTIVSGIIFLFSFYIVCYKVETRFFSAVLSGSIFMAISSLLFLTSLASDICEIHSCSLGPGGYIAIFDFFLWLAVAFVANRLKLLSQDPEYAYPASTSAVGDSNGANPSKYPQLTANVEKDVEETENDDGTVTRVTTLTTYEPDGNKKRVDKVKRKVNKKNQNQTQE